MSVSVSMPQLGESVTEGTVTRWLKKEGERVEADEPLLEVSTDKVDTEIPSPVAGVLRGITVAEDETVAVGAELAVIDETAGADGAPAAESSPDAAGSADGGAVAETPPGGFPAQGQADGYSPAETPPGGFQAQGQAAEGYQPPAAQPGVFQPAGPPAGDSSPTGFRPAGPPPDLGGRGTPAAGSEQQAEPEPSGQAPDPATSPADGWPQPQQAQQAEAQYAQAQQAEGQPAQAAAGQQAEGQQPEAQPQAQPQAQAPDRPSGYSAPPQPAAPSAYSMPPSYQATPAPGMNGPARPSAPPLTGADGPYVTPLVRKLAAEHGVDLGSIAGTGVGGRIRKQDVLDAARALREAAASQQAAAQAPAAQAPAGQAPAAQGPASQAAPQAQPGPAGPARQAKAIEPSSLRGTTERLSRARQVIARRMVESLQTSAQLTTVVEVDVTAIARLRDRAKADFEAREGVKLSFLPFFALAAIEALKVHPKLNAVIDPDGTQVTYHDAEHLGIAVDTDRGLMVPVIQNAGDLNVGGLARKIADLAARTRAGQVSPDDLAGGTFTVTNTGSRGALFDTPIINQPQVAILGTGIVARRAVVMEDPSLGEVITVRSMVYLALSYDHRLVDGADAARFLTTIKARLEEGAFEAELGL